jgi:hypothetical protein
VVSLTIQNKAVLSLAGLFLLLLLCTFLWAAGVEFLPFIETFPSGKADWDAGYFYGTGQGYPHLNEGSKAKALKVAQANALSAILQVASGLRVDDRRTLGDLERERVVIQIRGLIQYEPHEQQFVQEGKEPFYRVTYRAPMKGVKGLTQQILTHLRPQPAAGGEIGRGELSGSEDETSPWLVLDARGLSRQSRARPAIFPKIVTEKGETVSDFTTVEERALVEKGMARYVVSDKSREDLMGMTQQERAAGLLRLLSPPCAFAQEKGERKRQAKFIVKDVTQVQGLTKTNLVVSDADAKEIREEDASSQILKKCRVIVVVSSSLGGIEGSLSGPLALSR